MRVKLLSPVLVSLVAVGNYGCVPPAPTNKKVATTTTAPTTTKTVANTTATTDPKLAVAVAAEVAVEEEAGDLHTNQPSGFQALIILHSHHSRLVCAKYISGPGKFGNRGVDTKDQSGYDPAKTRKP